MIYQELEIHPRVKELQVAQEEVLLNRLLHGSKSEQGMALDSVPYRQNMHFGAAEP
jgi:hypothetical protein